GSGVYNRSKKGIVVYGHVRDMEGLRAIDGFQGWIKGSDPSYMRKTLLTNINTPIRIGQATVLPGDAVLAKKDGVIFIPAHLVEHIVLTGEVTALFDVFGQQMIKQGKYSAGVIDSEWTAEIKSDFRSWAKNNPDQLPMSLAALEKYLESRNF
ncbi:MAG: RraA family protein, partial [Candidatus Cyclobacteriaceae bacterium M3_2C_046]